MAKFLSVLSLFAECDGSRESRLLWRWRSAEVWLLYWLANHETDLTFFTNDKHGTLLDRYKAILADTQLFDVLVGYF